VVYLLRWKRLKEKQSWCVSQMKENEKKAIGRGIKKGKCHKVQNKMDKMQS
jgi:hypothetical protein